MRLVGSQAAGGRWPKIGNLAMDTDHRGQSSASPHIIEQGKGDGVDGERLLSHNQGADGLSKLKQGLGAPIPDDSECIHDVQPELGSDFRKSHDIGDVGAAPVVVEPGGVFDQGVREVLQAAGEPGDVVTLQERHVDDRVDLLEDARQVVLSAAEVGFGLLPALRRRMAPKLLPDWLWNLHERELIGPESRITE